MPVPVPALVADGEGSCMVSLYIPAGTGRPVPVRIPAGAPWAVSMTTENAPAAGVETGRGLGPSAVSGEMAGMVGAKPRPISPAAAKAFCWARDALFAFFLAAELMAASHLHHFSSIHPMQTVHGVPLAQKTPLECIHVQQSMWSSQLARGWPKASVLNGFAIAAMMDWGKNNSGCLS